jgi:RNA polymerase sigma factor (sigma-70 family)
MKMLRYTPQQLLAVEHLDLVKWVIRDNITVNENICGFGYDDLYQEGCVHLCRAAATYDGSKAKFRTYARVVICNGLIDHCRRFYNKRIRFVSLDDSEALPQSVALVSKDVPIDTLTETDAVRLLEAFKPELSGVALRGIEALQLKVQGQSVTQIAASYGVKPNQVGAWISKAATKLKCNPRFITALGRDARQ